MRENQDIKNQIAKRREKRERAPQTQHTRGSERHFRRRRKYGQAKLKHAKKGIWSCAIAGTVFGLLSVLIAIAYLSGGTAAGYIGGAGLIAAILSIIGMYWAIRGFKEREKDYLTCKIGIGCNLFFLLGFVAIFCRGLF